MVTTFNTKDMISFAKYVLSEERTKKIRLNNGTEVFDQVVKEVHHADLENWKEKQK